MSSRLPNSDYMSRSTFGSWQTRTGTVLTLSFAVLLLERARCLQDPDKRPTIKVLQDAEAVDSIDHYTKLVAAGHHLSLGSRVDLRC